ADKKPKEKADRDLAEQIEAARDDVELLEAQLDIKRAEVGEVEARLKLAVRRLEKIKSLDKYRRVSRECVEQAQGEAEVVTAQLTTKKAQVREVEVRLRQAKRRLDRLQEQRAKERACWDAIRCYQC